MPSTIEELIFKYPCSPPHALTQLPEFFNNTNLNFIHEKHSSITIPIRNWTAKLMGWTLGDYNKYYNNIDVKPYFNAYGAARIGKSDSGVYFSVEKSLQIAIELLNHQFGDIESVLDFLKTLYNVVEQKIPKLNSIWCSLSTIGR